MSDRLLIETPRGPVWLDIGREYIIQPPNPRKKKNRDRRCVILAFVSGGSNTPQDTMAQVKYLDTRRPGRVALAELWPADTPPPPRWWHNDPRLAVEYRLRELARLALETQLLQNLAAAQPALEELLRQNSGEGYADPIYRFYHQSFKVYDLQEQTAEIVAQLQALLPGRPLNQWFMQIVQEGTGKTFAMEDNARWLPITRPIVEAYFHARYFLEMAVRFAGTMTVPAQSLPSGYAALLYLNDLR